MSLLLVIFIAALALSVLLVSVRAWETDAWRQSLVRYRLSLPRDLTSKDVAGWLAQVGSHTVPPRLSLLPVWPVVVEIEASSRGITHTVLVPENRAVALLASLKASLPGVRVDAVVGDEPVVRYRAGVELRLTSQTTPLGDDRATTVANGVLAAMQPLPHGSSVRVQWLFAGVRAKQATGIGTDPMRWFVNANPDERLALRDARQKRRAPLLVAAGRIAASGEPDHAFAVVHRVVGALRVLEAPGAHFLWRMVPSWLVQRRIASRTVPLLAWPLTLNALEAVGAVAFPLDGVSLPGLKPVSSRQVPPHPDMPRTGTVIGESSYPGTVQPLALKPRDRLMHTYVLGQSGTGKSTLLASMALQAIAAGQGGVVFDFKGDLVADLLARFPRHREPDLWLLDPSDLRAPVGFNPLRAAGSEHQRELAAETISHVLKDMYREFWGPRTDDLLRAALLSLVRVPAPNSEPFALTEVPELFTNAGLRRYVANHPRQHERWRQYWGDYDRRSQAEQLSMVGPVLNKLRNFTHRTSLRLVLGQAAGLDLMEVFTSRKVLLVPLSEGKIGAEASALIGSLLVASLWQATLRRAAIPAEQRRPVFAHLDEFQRLVRISDDVPDMLAMARGLGLELVLAHQYIRQLPEAVRAAVLGTARTQVFFQTDHDDAIAVAKRLAPVLTADDLMGLGQYEIAARLCIDGQTRTPVSGRTLPLPAATRDPAELRAELAAHLGTPRTEIEAGLLARSHAKSRERPTRLGEVPIEGGPA